MGVSERVREREKKRGAKGSTNTSLASCVCREHSFFKMEKKKKKILPAAVRDQILNPPIYIIIILRLVFISEPVLDKTPTNQTPLLVNLT